MSPLVSDGYSLELFLELFLAQGGSQGCRERWTEAVVNTDPIGAAASTPKLSLGDFEPWYLIGCRLEASVPVYVGLSITHSWVNLFFPESGAGHPKMEAAVSEATCPHLSRMPGQGSPSQIGVNAKGMWDLGGNRPWDPLGD